jgi:hypothetical protein
MMRNKLSTATKMKHLIRCSLSVLLLWQVFLHAHWSVGVCLTLSMVAVEVQTLVIEIPRNK